MLAPLQGRGWASSEVFGIAPDPTAIATLGVLLLARGRLLPVLLPIPVLWCLLSGMTLQHDGRAASLRPLCRPCARRCRLDLDDHPAEAPIS